MANSIPNVKVPTVAFRIPTRAPNRNLGSLSKVEVPATKTPPAPSAGNQPTNAQIYAALVDVIAALAVVHKNQQALESRLNQMQTIQSAIDSNVIMGANWLEQWCFLLEMLFPGVPGYQCPAGTSPPWSLRWK